MKTPDAYPQPGGVGAPRALASSQYAGFFEPLLLTTPNPCTFDPSPLSSNRLTRTIGMSAIRRRTS